MLLRMATSQHLSHMPAAMTAMDHHQPPLPTALSQVQSSPQVWHAGLLGGAAPSASGLSYMPVPAPAFWIYNPVPPLHGLQPLQAVQAAGVGRAMEAGAPCQALPILVASEHATALSPRTASVGSALTSEHHTQAGSTVQPMIAIRTRRPASMQPAHPYKQCSSCQTTR